MSWRLLALDVWLRLNEKPRLRREPSVEVARARMERQAVELAPLDAEWREAVVGGRDALRRDGPEGGRLILWLHGGAYCLGSPRTHAGVVAALVRRAEVGAVLPSYRLAPEHPFPAALDDAAAVWAGLRAEGWPAERLLIGGDSAGGGLAFALLHRLLEAGERPAAVVAFSPWTDLTLLAESLRTLARRDAYLPVARITEVRDQYLAGADPRDPGASPRFGRFAGGPPVLIQASRAEILRDDAKAMAARLRADGVDCRLELVRGVPHVWQAFAGALPEADAALDRAGAFIRRA